MIENKEVELYAAQANAWVNTKFEHDKSLLTLSAGGIGLLITIVIALGADSVAVIFLYAFALLAFITSLVSLLFIFKRNAHYLEKTIQGHEGGDPILGALDNIALGAFLMGVFLSSIIGITSATESFIKKEQEMSDKAKQQNLRICIESLDGINKIKPTNAQASINKINNLKPSEKQPTPASTPATNEPKNQEK